MKARKVLLSARRRQSARDFIINVVKNNVKRKIFIVILVRVLWKEENRGFGVMGAVDMMHTMRLNHLHLLCADALLLRLQYSCMLHTADVHTSTYYVRVRVHTKLTLFSELIIRTNSGRYFRLDSVLDFSLSLVFLCNFLFLVVTFIFFVRLLQLRSLSV